MKTMPITPVFNPTGNDDDRQIWFGNPTNLMELNNTKYGWAVQLYQQMRENFWIPQRIDLTQDITDYNLLTSSERRAYNGILSYLTFLDSVQTCNIPHLKGSITAPEISLCMAEQISQEAMHNQSYQYLIETIIPSDDRTKVYEFWRTDTVLRERCEFVAKLYQGYLDNQTQVNYFISLAADYLLEGIYFYNGFQFYYNLASRQLMPGTSDMFKMINRDELSHVRLYQKLLPEALAIMPELEQEIYQMTETAVSYECLWTGHILGDEILGITKQSTKQYTEYLANVRLKAIGLDPLYDTNENPYKHLERLSDTKSEGHTKANFFESTVTSYVMSSGIDNWDF